GAKRMYRVDFMGWYNAGRNHRVQGGAAHIQKISEVMLQEFIRENQVNAALVNSVHDEVIIKVAKDEADEFHEHHKRIMVEAGSMFLKTVPMKVEGGLSEAWTKH